MKTKHTPGPWEACNGEVTTQRIENRSFRRIAAIQDYGLGCSPEVDAANARLIAAAPELLEALRALTQWIEDNAPTPGDPQCEWCDHLDKARAAIAKAI